MGRPGWLVPGGRRGEGVLPPELSRLLLDCRWDEAGGILDSVRDSIPAAAGAHVIVQLMKYLSSFELQHKQPVFDSIKWTENHWNLQSPTSDDETDEFYTRAAVLNLEVILADSTLCEALTHFVSMDVSGYMKGSWKLRGTWKSYERTYKKAKELFDQYQKLLSGNDETKCTCSLADQRPKSYSQFDYQSIAQNVETKQDGLERPRASSNTETSKDSIHSCLKHGRSVRETDSNSQLTRENMEKSEIAHQLLSSAAFGYGLFNLVMSILSPQALRIVQFFGFPGDRRLGLACLKFVSRSRHPLKGPFATLALLWWHTVVRPFFALDGSIVTAGCAEAENLIRRQPDSEHTVLYLFFRGRCQRLKREVTGALSNYDHALELAGDQRELRLMVTYEVGWCHLLLGNWSQAKTAFLELRDNSRWSPAYYCYVGTLCTGLEGREEEAKKLVTQILPLIQRKNNPVEAFVSKRARKLEKVKQLGRGICLVHMLELIYIWKGLDHAPDQSLQTFITSLESEERSSLECLVKAAVLLKIGHMGWAEQLLREGIKVWEGREGKEKSEKHIPAFCSYELGALLAATFHNFDEAKKILESCKSKYKGYDFESRLVVRVDAALALVAKQKENNNNRTPNAPQS